MFGYNYLCQKVMFFVQRYFKPFIIIVIEKNQIRCSVLLVFINQKSLLTDKRERKHYPLAEVINFHLLNFSVHGDIEVEIYGD